MILSEIGNSALIFLIVAIGSINGLITADHIIRNTTKEEFSYLRYDVTLFMAACIGIYAMGNYFSPVFIGGGLAIVNFAYLSWFVVGMALTMSQFLDIPFFSIKSKKT